MTAFYIVAGLTVYFGVMLALAAGMRGDSTPRPRIRSTGHPVGRWENPRTRQIGRFVDDHKVDR